MEKSYVIANNDGSKLFVQEDELWLTLNVCCDGKHSEFTLDILEDESESRRHSKITAFRQLAEWFQYRADAEEKELSRAK